MPRACEWCGTKLLERTFRRSGRRLRYCGRRCQRKAYNAAEGKTVTPRHQGRPETSDRIYSEDEAELLKAVIRWRARNGGRIPHCTEVLAIVIELGYRKQPGE